jgi:Ca2+-binding EF-hand superfamily protein
LVQRKIVHLFRALDMDADGFLEQAHFARVVDGAGKVGSFRNVIDTSGMVEACLGGRPFTVR